MASSSNPDKNEKMPAKLKNLVMLPVLLLSDLWNSNKVDSFVHDFKAFKINNTETRLKQCISGTAWKTLISLSLGKLKEKEGVDPYDFTDKELLETLTHAYHHKSKNSVLIDFKGIKMEMRGTESVDLERCVMYYGQYNELIERTSAVNLPDNKILRRVFFEGIQHSELKTRVRESAKHSSWERLGEKFLSIAVEMSSMDAEVDTTRASAKRESKKAAVMGNEDVAALVKATMAGNFQTNTASTTNPGTSRGAKKRAVKALSGKFVPKEQSVPVCWGCGNKGHTRPLCTFKSHKDYKAYPEKRTSPIRGGFGGNGK